MRIERFGTIGELHGSGIHATFSAFMDKEPHAQFFQSPEYLEFIGPVEGFRPVLFIALDDRSRVVGSLLGVYQRDGGGLKSWMSRRLIVMGGPLGDVIVAEALISALLKDAQGNAIYVEFRNSFDTSKQRAAFERAGFTYVPHLNFLLEVEGEEAAFSKLSSTRRREVRGSLNEGATFGEATSPEEVDGFYRILEGLYREKVRKPLPARDLFHRLHTSPNGRVFVVRYQGRIVGGSAGPAYGKRALYYWYACGDNSIKGVHASVLATWAPIQHAARNGIALFDFMGAGKPGQGYGVHDFKARFGGTEVSHGRYEKVLDRTLFRLGISGLKAYQGMKALIARVR